MKKDQESLKKATDALNAFLIRRNLTKYYTYDTQGYLFDAEGNGWGGFDEEPIVTIN